MRRSWRVVAFVTVLVMVLSAGITLCEAKGGPPPGKNLEQVQKKVDKANEQIWDCLLYTSRCV